MRLGIVIYFIPFFFVINPALILQGSPLEILHTFSTCVLGIVLIAGAVEGYILKLGVVSQWWLRLLFLLSGILLALPEWGTDLIGIGLVTSIIALHWPVMKVTRV
ncbi:hypothetical protein ES703_22536 [subsurface metagenome]